MVEVSFRSEESKFADFEDGRICSRRSDSEVPSSAYSERCDEGVNEREKRERHEVVIC